MRDGELAFCFLMSSMLKSRIVPGLMEWLSGVPAFILGRVCENFVLILYEMFAGAYQLLKKKKKTKQNLLA